MKAVWAVAFLVFASGCMQDQGEEEDPDLFGACPQWVAGPTTWNLDAQVDGSESLELAPEVDEEPVLTHDGRPLDLYLLRFDVNGSVEVRIHAEDGSRLEIKEVTDDGVERHPFIIVSGQREVEVFLSPVEHGSTAAPGGLRIDVEGSGDVQVEATPFYRVCGVVA